MKQKRKKWKIIFRYAYYTLCTIDISRTVFSPFHSIYILLYFVAMVDRHANFLLGTYFSTDESRFIR